MQKYLICIIAALFLASCAAVSYNEPLTLNLAQNADHLTAVELNYKADKKEFLKRYFSPWQRLIDGGWDIASEPNLFWAFNVYRSERGFYGINKLPKSAQWFEAQLINANTDKLGSINAFALIKRGTDLRAFATSERLFKDPNMAGEGYPFDYLQLSYLSPFTPVVISHYSGDGVWAFVATSDVWGFVRAGDLLVLSQDEAKKYMSLDFGVFSADGGAIKNLDGDVIAVSRAGGVFGYEKESEQFFEYQNIQISKSFASHFKELSPNELKSTLKAFLGQEYGWGGENALRDCSLFVSDYFSQFGIWMPRNSAAQAKNGLEISLEGLSNEQKKELIKDRAVPFMSLIYLPGHIMIYAGLVDGEPAVVHDVWGIKTKNSGRAMIGRVAITKLDEGFDRSDIDSKNLLISRAKKLTIISADELALIKGYGVKIKDGEVIFPNGSKMSFDSVQTPSIKDTLMLKYPKENPIGQNLLDAGRARNEEFLKAIYGANELEVSANLLPIIWLKDFGAKKISFNSQNGAANALMAVSEELNSLVKNDPKFLKYLVNIGGTFKWRNIANSNSLSAHSWGIAIDINVANSHYWQWSDNYQNLIPKEIIEVFERHGFIWGGRWEHFDTMHFEYRPELMAL